MWKLSIPSSKWCRDSIPRLLEHESTPITTRPGIPPFVQNVLASIDKCFISNCFIWQNIEKIIKRPCRTRSVRPPAHLQRKFNPGPWWWSSGQRARLLFRRSEFESRWGLQFFCKIFIEKNENKQKEARVGRFFKIENSLTGCIFGCIKFRHALLRFMQQITQAWTSL